jgi:hypothetical protein
MRLNGKRQILAYLGKAPSNWRAWTLVKLRYATAIFRISRTSANRGYWALSEELDAIDREKGAAVSECEYGNLLRDVTTYRHHLQRVRARGAIR